MTLTRQRLAEKAAAVERHLRRVADRLPHPDEPFESATDADLRAFLAAARDALSPDRR
jgi:hypothetical protein